MTARCGLGRATSSKPAARNIETVPGKRSAAGFARAWDRRRTPRGPVRRSRGRSRSRPRRGPRDAPAPERPRDHEKHDTDHIGVVEVVIGGGRATRAGLQPLERRTRLDRAPADQGVAVVGEETGPRAGLGQLGGETVAQSSRARSRLHARGSCTTGTSTPQGRPWCRTPTRRRRRAPRPLGRYGGTGCYSDRSASSSSTVARGPPSIRSSSGCGVRSIRSSGIRSIRRSVAHSAAVPQLSHLAGSPVVGELLAEHSLAEQRRGPPVPARVVGEQGDPLLHPEPCTRTASPARHPVDLGCAARHRVRVPVGVRPAGGEDPQGRWGGCLGGIPARHDLRACCVASPPSCDRLW